MKSPINYFWLKVLIGTSTISRVVFHCQVWLPEGIEHHILSSTCLNRFSWFVFSIPLNHAWQYSLDLNQIKTLNLEIIWKNTLFTRSFRMITICEFATRFSPMSSRKMIRHRDTETSIDIQLDIYVYIWYRLYGNIMNKNIHDVHLYNICLSRRCL